MESLIFVALAVAWLVYLVPKGLKMHEESRQSDAVEEFSDDLRVVARRDVVAKTSTELKVSRPVRTRQRLVAEEAPESVTVSGSSVGVADAAPMAEAIDGDRADASGAMVAPARPSLLRRLGSRLVRLLTTPARFVAARRAGRGERGAKAPMTPSGRRRRVLGSLLVLTVAIAALAASGLVSWWGMALPGGLVAGWLVACRLMVRGEQTRRPAARPTARTPRTRRPRSTEETLAGVVLAEDDDLDDEPHTPYAGEAQAAPGSWDLVPMMLPTYVTKDVAGPRTPRPFELDSTGVFSSGRSAKDSEIARAAEQQAAEQRERDRAADERALGS